MLLTFDLTKNFFKCFDMSTSKGAFSPSNSSGGNRNSFVVKGLYFCNPTSSNRQEKYLKLLKIPSTSFQSTRPCKDSTVVLNCTSNK